MKGPGSEKKMVISLNERRKKVVFSTKEFEEATMEADVKSVAVLPATDVFGEKAKRADRMVAVLSLSEEDRLTMGIPDGLEYDEDKNEWYMDQAKLTTIARSIKNPQSKLGRYIAKYGHPPKVGDKILVTLDANGFLQPVM